MSVRRGAAVLVVLTVLFSMFAMVGGTAGKKTPKRVRPVGKAISSAVGSANLVVNPSFEANTTGWFGWQSNVQRLAQTEAPDGGYVSRVQVASCFCYYASYSIDDTANPISSTTTGARFTASAYVSAGSGSAIGRPIYIVIRERTPSGANVRTTTSARTLLSSGWTKIAVAATASGSGNTLDMYVYQAEVNSSDNAFKVDRLYFGASPVASFTQQNGSSYSGSPVALSGSAVGFSGSTTARVSFDSLDKLGGLPDGLVSGTACSDTARTTGTWSCSWDASRFVSGPYRLTVTVTDGVGASSSESIDIKYANTNPQHQNANAYQYWSSGRAITRVEQDLTFTTKAQATYGSIYWTTPVNYGGYMGLQTNGTRTDGSTGDTVIFSWWDKSTATADRSVATQGSCMRFGGEGDGVSCRLAYPIVKGRTYRMRLERVLDNEWAAFITDSATSTETKVGQIRIIDTTTINQPMNFLEYFGVQQPTCNDVPASAVTFGSPLVTASGTSITASAGSSTSGACSGAAAGGSSVAGGRQLRLGS